jgi:hypothetical protein
LTLSKYQAPERIAAARSHASLGHDALVDRESAVLQALVDEENLDRLFSLVSLDDVAIAWCRSHSAPRSIDGDDPDWWAVDLFFTRAISERSMLYRSLLLKLIEHANEADLGNIGAGPLEDFVSDDTDDLAWLESQCASNPKLRTALAGVWCSNHVSEETLERLDVAAGVKLARLTPRAG